MQHHDTPSLHLYNATCLWSHGGSCPPCGGSIQSFVWEGEELRLHGLCWCSSPPGRFLPISALSYSKIITNYELSPGFCGSEFFCLLNLDLSHLLFVPLSLYMICLLLCFFSLAVSPSWNNYIIITLDTWLTHVKAKDGDEKQLQLLWSVPLLNRKASYHTFCFSSCSSLLGTLRKTGQVVLISIS